jgi:Bacterial pre-peptidase C-terminal domain
MNHRLETHCEGQVEFNMSDPGNTLPTATLLTLTETPQVLTQAVSSTDTLDYYRFQLASRSHLDLKLAGLSGDANLRLIHDRNGNNQIDGDELFAQSSNPATLSELVNQPGLVAGTYFIEISLGGGKFCQL